MSLEEGSGVTSLHHHAIITAFPLVGGVVLVAWSARVCYVSMCLQPILVNPCCYRTLCLHDTDACSAQFCLHDDISMALCQSSCLSRAWSRLCTLAVGFYYYYGVEHLAQRPPAWLAVFFDSVGRGGDVPCPARALPVPGPAPEPDCEAKK